MSIISLRIGAKCSVCSLPNSLSKYDAKRGGAVAPRPPRLCGAERMDAAARRPYRYFIRLLSRDRRSDEESSLPAAEALHPEQHSEAAHEGYEAAGLGDRD